MNQNEPNPSYLADWLAVWYKNVDFLKDPRFVAAYRHGMASGHHIGRQLGSDDDIHIEWRVHVLLWAASCAAKLEGDFVECGVNTGIFSLAVCEYLDFNRTGKSFYLFDTFCGIPPEQVAEEERKLGRMAENQEMYSECFDIARRNFAPYPNAHLVRGKVPDTLRSVAIRKVCYLSIDMNIVAPEIAAIEFFWDRLSPGAPVILDDYGWSNYRLQKEAMDRFAESKGVAILNLPTGQGLLLKPPALKRSPGRKRRS
jgi:O-methyltransferase